MFPFEWVSDPQWRKTPASVTALILDPEVIQPAVSVQEAWNRGTGILRGVRDADGLLEDHTWDLLDADGRLVRSPEHLCGSERIRAQSWPATQHVAAYEAAHPGERVVGWTGNGNLLNNDHFVAFDGRRSPSALYCLSSEVSRIGEGGRDYTCLVTWKVGRRPRVTLERLRFTENAVYSSAGEEITDAIEYATYGQQILENGRVVDDDAMIRMVEHNEFYDLRHLFLFGRIELAPGRWIDAGLEALLDPRGPIDPAKAADAWRGRRVRANVGQFPERLVDEAMQAKGYARSEQVERPGDYHLNAGILTTVLRRGIYPHSMVGIDAAGKLIVAVIKGLSNRVGVSVPGAGEVMRLLGARDAILIDNGGDVMMSVGGAMVLRSSEGDRHRLRSILIYRTEGRHRTLDSTQLRTVEYPPQYAPTRTTAPSRV